VTRFDTFTQFEKPKTEFQKLDFEAAPISEEAIDDDFPREPVSGVEDFRQTRDEHGGMCIRGTCVEFRQRQERSCLICFS